MIARIVKEDPYCYVYFAGSTREDYLKYAAKVVYAGLNTWKNTKGAWECHINAYDFLSRVFLSDISLDDIGKDMKLAPYQYQKKLIYDIVNHQELLLVSPCGSGKTPIGIGAFLELRNHGFISQNSVGIILVKATLKIQWQKEIGKFSELRSNIVKSYADVTASYKSKITALQNKIKACDKIADKAKIKELKSKIKDYENAKSEAFDKQFHNNDLLILNYEALKDKKISEKLKELNIEYIFADEVHKISNRKAQLSQAAYEFNYIKYKVGATATAISNNPENIFGLYSFIAPNLFPSFSTFSKQFIRYAGYGRVIGCKNEAVLSEKYKNNIVVVTKEEVSKHLPKLSVNQQYCEMTSEQAEMMARILDELKEAKDQEFLLSQKSNDQKDFEDNPEYVSIKARIMMLQTFAQELSDDPRLLLHSKSEYAIKYELHNSYSPKTAMMFDLVSEILDSGEKVIIISRYVNMLNLIKEDLQQKFPNVKYAEVNGSMNDKERYDNIYTKFRDNPEYKILLMSDAGSTGTNASTAQYIIEFDLAESYATQTQRHGRIERADSIHKNVFVYQLITKDSYDEIQQLIVNKKETYDSNLIKIFAKGK